MSPSYFILFVLLEPFGLLTLLSYLTPIMSQFSEHDYSTLECLLNHSWANKRWGEQLPRKIPIDTLGSMVEASDGSTGLRGPHLQRDYRMPGDDIEFDIKNLPAMPWDLTSTTFNDIPQQVEYLTPSTYTATKKRMTTSCRHLLPLWQHRHPREH